MFGRILQWKLLGLKSSFTKAFKWWVQFLNNYRTVQIIYFLLGKAFTIFEAWNLGSLESGIGEPRWWAMTWPGDVTPGGGSEGRGKGDEREATQECSPELTTTWHEAGLRAWFHRTPRYPCSFRMISLREEWESWLTGAICHWPVSISPMLLSRLRESAHLVLWCLTSSSRGNLLVPKSHVAPAQMGERQSWTMLHELVSLGELGVLVSRTERTIQGRRDGGAETVFIQWWRKRWLISWKSRKRA